MGLSFHDENSLVDRVGSLHFASIPKIGSVGDQESPGGNLTDFEISDIHRDIDSHVFG